MGQPLKCLFQNDLQKCPVENIYLGSLCEKDGWRIIIHRNDRCDLSLFQLGLRTLAYFLNEDFSIPVMFHIII